MAKDSKESAGTAERSDIAEKMKNGYGKGKGVRVNSVEDDESDDELAGGEQQCIDINMVSIVDPTA